MNQYKKVAFYTLGCKLNFSETSTISRTFQEAGFAKVDFDASPDVFVINTCSVTENADKKCRQLVKRALKSNPNGFVAIIGCFAQLKPTEIAEIPGVDIVLGANEKFNIIEHIESLDKKEQAVISNTHIKETKEFIPAFSMGDRTRSFLKVQDGCDYFCTFCTIPLARGKSRNASIASTIEEAEKIAATDIKEVVLTGVNIGDFGQGGDENFFGLVKALDQVNGIDRYRISSIEPNLLSDEIISYCLSETARFVPHFHIPLQSGSNKLLKAMRRKYERELFANRVAQIKLLRPDACIGVDVIVGFPGETDEDFEETLSLCREVRFDDGRRAELSTREAELLRYLARWGHPVPERHLERDWSRPHAHDDALVDVFAAIYADTGRCWREYSLCEDLVDLESQFQLWRYRHMRTVMRIIGFKKGTGGSSGVGFLRQALDLSFFPELFDARTRIGQAG